MIILGCFNKKFDIFWGVFMNLKKIYMLCSNDMFELPITIFDNYKELANFLNIPLGTARCLFCRGFFNPLLSDKLNKYKYRKIIIDEDDEEENVKYAISGYYGKTGEFFGEYSNYETAKVCCDKLLKKGCYHVIMSEIETKNIIYEVYNGLHRKVK